MLTTRPNGTIIYTPFPDYEVTDPPAANNDTTRTIHRLAGQMVAARVHGTTDVYYYAYADHLGSIAAWSQTGGTPPVNGYLSRYEPFGGYRTRPDVAVNPDISSRGFTGHRGNNTGTQGVQNLNLIYMNARYYMPEIGRFVSADTIVPEPKSPQSYNRYSYSLNNPLRYTDPTGHCATEDDDCWGFADELYRRFGWMIQGVWQVRDLQIFLQAGDAIIQWLARNGGGDAAGRARAIFGGTVFAHTDWIGEIAVPGKHHVRESTVYLLSSFGVGSVIHELGHVLDNRLGFSWPIGSALLGRGPADDMSRTLGANPSGCPNRSVCEGYSTPLEEMELGAYARSGPSEDFAEAFRYSVMDVADYPMRASFVSNLASSLVTNQAEFNNPSFYYPQRITPVAAPVARTPASLGTPVP